jgi:hypothetical protein
MPKKAILVIRGLILILKNQTLDRVILARWKPLKFPALQKLRRFEFLRLEKSRR